jgi:hypothetical protein
MVSVGGNNKISGLSLASRYQNCRENYIAAAPHVYGVMKHCLTRLKRKGRIRRNSSAKI